MAYRQVQTRAKTDHAAVGPTPAAFVQQDHTILLIQPSPSTSSRTFVDYETVAEGIDGLCSMFERRLKETNPTMRNITYDIGDLYSFVDSLPDVSALVFDPSINAYIPYDRKWLKERAYEHLSKLAGL